MEFVDVVRQRKMIRTYKPDPIDPKAVERIVTAGLRGPSAGFSQGIGFVVVTDDAVRVQVNEILGPDIDGRRGLAPVQIVITAEEQRYHDTYAEARKLAEAMGQEFVWPVPYWFVDAGAAMMLILLAAVDEGLDAGFYGHPEHVGKLQAALDIPAGVIPIGVVTIGHGDHDDAVKATFQRMRGRRRPSTETVHRDRWGSSLEP